jgi:hypothetical protein
MLVLMLRTTRVLSVALALFTTTACSSTSDPGEARREGTLTIHHGDDVHSTDCRGNEILRDAQGNPTLVQDDGELTAVCFGNARLGISFGVQNFLELGPSFDLMNDERVSFYAEFPVGELDGSLSSRGAAEHRFQGSFDAAANRVVAKLTSSFAETTPQADLGTLGAPTSFELSIDFRAK